MSKKEKRQTCWACELPIEEGEKSIRLDFYVDLYYETGDPSYLEVYAHYSCVEDMARERRERDIDDYDNYWLKYLPEDFDPADRLKAMRARARAERERNKPTTLLKWIKKDER